MRFGEDLMKIWQYWLANNGEMVLRGPRNVLLSKITHAQGKAKPKEWYQAPVGIVCFLRQYIITPSLNCIYPEDLFLSSPLPYSAHIARLLVSEAVRVFEAFLHVMDFIEFILSSHLDLTSHLYK